MIGPLLSPSRSLVVGLALALSASVAVAQDSLIPVPREYHATQNIHLINGAQIVCSACDSDDAFAAGDLQSNLTARDIAISATGIEIAFLREASPVAKSLLSAAGMQFTHEMFAEGYAIVGTPNGLAVIGATAEGVFYGAQTVRQMIEGSGTAATLNAATIRDWPAMRYRGVHDDLSRGPVPTLEFQKMQIRTFAAYKINIYSPYFENTMQYDSDPLAAPPEGSVSAADARELVQYARQFHITIIPEQEAFGHLHYMLNWEMYTPLAETPHGNVLAPGQPGSIGFITRMFTELAAIYPGPFLHIGADETVELGKGQTKLDVDSLGLGPVYLNYLKRIDTDLKPLNRRLLFWGDIAMDQPDLLKELPNEFKQNTVAVAWEYQPQPKGYARFIEPFTKAGIECWVSPGVTNWYRVYPNYNAAFLNIQQFTAEGQRLGCTGQLNTVWVDDGEALFNANWYGILFGAAAAWQTGMSSVPVFQSSFGHVFHGDATGKIDEAQRELMAAHAVLKSQYKGSDGTNSLFWVDPWSPDGLKIREAIRPFTHDLRLHAENALVLIAQARRSGHLRENDALDVMELGARRFDLIGLKFQLTDEIATEYTYAYSLQSSTDRETRKEIARSLSDISQLNFVYGKLEDLRNNYTLIGELYREAWAKSYRPYWLGNVTARYDMTTQLWIARMEKLRSAQLQWAATHTLPIAASIGIPAPPLILDPNSHR
jgi:hexosaminidase